MKTNTLSSEAPPAEKAGTPTGQKELLACPFCGSYDIAQTESMNEHWLSCAKCFAHAPARPSLEMAKQAWNRRAEPQPEAAAGQTDEEIAREFSEKFTWQDMKPWESSSKTVMKAYDLILSALQQSRAVRQEGKIKELGRKRGVRTNMIPTQNALPVEEKALRVIDAARNALPSFKAALSQYHCEVEEQWEEEEEPYVELREAMHDLDSSVLEATKSDSVSGIPKSGLLAEAERKLEEKK